MASPPSSITTVRGRRCTRSRARTATAATTPAISAPSAQQPSFVIFSQFSSPTGAQQAPQIQTGPAALPTVIPAPPPPPPQPPSSSPSSPPSQPSQPSQPSESSSSPTTSTEQSAVAPTSEAPTSSTIGTTSDLSQAPARITPLANLPPSGEALAGLGQPAIDLSSPLTVSSQGITSTSTPTPPASPTSTSSDTAAATVPTLSSSTNPPLSSSANPIVSPLVTAPAFPAVPTAPVAQSSANIFPDQPVQSNKEPLPSSLFTSIAQLPQRTTSSVFSISSADPTGIIAPEQGSNGGTALTQHHTSSANVGSIVGGVIGGIAGLALIAGLLFFCLRKRQSRASAWDEKKERVSHQSFIEKLSAVGPRVSTFFATLKGKKTGPTDNPYQRHTTQMSASSIYSEQSNSRRRSTSEPQAMFATQRTRSTRSSSNRMNGRNLGPARTGSDLSNYRFPNIGEDVTLQNQNTYLTPYADLDPPRDLQLLNPDPNSGPVTPEPAAAPKRLSRDQFSLMLDQIEDVPDWLTDSSSNPGHMRTQSSISAPRFHLPLLTQFKDDNPFRDPENPPSMPTQAAVSDHQRQSSMAYPAFNATSIPVSRDSQFTFFGEPGPSRPGTNLFTPGLPTGRTMRQSDPFDLDRPEVLALGNMPGGKQMTSTFTRQGSRNKPTSN